MITANLPGVRRGVVGVVLTDVAEEHVVIVVTGSTGLLGFRVRRTPHQPPTSAQPSAGRAVP